jgi:tetratricopeptide (TPR) repeat protein
MRTDPSAAAGEAEQVAEQTIATFEKLGDTLGLAQARHLLAYVHVTKGKWGVTQQVIERALSDAERAGDQRERAALLNALSACLFFGPTHVDEAIARSGRILEAGNGDRSLEAAVSALVGAMEAMQGRFDQARDLARHSRDIFEDLGVLAWLAKGCRVLAGAVELLAGDPVTAEREFRWCHETLARMGDRDGASYTGALLAEALCEQGRFADADVLAQMARETRSAWILTQTTADRVRAAVLAHRGELEAALSVAEEATALAGQTDSPNMHADALQLHGRLLLADDDAEHARDRLRRAVDLYAAKGNVVAARETAAILDPSTSHAVRSASP